jgi:hypothetical protein
MTDGKYKKNAPDRGGVVESIFADERQDMSAIWHGFAETPAKTLPDGRVDHPPYYFDVTDRVYTRF